MIHAMTTQAVDIVLAALLLVGGVVGAQYGAMLTTRLKPDLLRLALAIIILLVALRMALGPRLAARRNLSRSNICEARPPFLPALAPLLMAPVQAASWSLTFRRARSRSATASPARNCCCSARSSIPAAGSPADPADIVVVLKGPVEPIVVREKQKIAGIWMNADSNRFRSAPSLLCRRLVAPGRAIWSMSAPRRSTNSVSRTCSCRPAAGRLPDKERRFEAGLLDLRKRQGLYAEHPRGVEISEGVLYRARISIPSQVPGRHLHRRDLPDRRRQGDRRRDARDRDREIRLRALRRAGRTPPRLPLRPRRGAAVARRSAGPRPWLFRRRF